jgi:hypothetical protein
MDGPMNLLGHVAGVMLHDEPLLESVLVMPLILKRYRTVLIACLLVAAATFGVEMHNDYSPRNLLSPVSLTLFAAQALVLLTVSAIVFALKVQVFRALKITEPMARKAAPPATPE